MKKLFIICLGIFFLLACTPQVSRLDDNSQGASGNSTLGSRFAWDMHTNTTVTGYRLYQRYDELNQRQLANIPGRNTTEISIADLDFTLDENAANFVYLTAYDGDNQESGPSAIICWGLACPE